MVKNIHIYNVPLYNINNEVKVLTGVGTTGDFYKKPITFKNYNLILNGSFYELKLEIYGEKNNLEIIKKFYEELYKYGEWGEDFIKPLIGMEILSNNKYIKSKKYIEINDLDEYIDDYFKITLYFEPLMDEDLFEEDYIKSNAYGINSIGGLYYVVDIDGNIGTNSNYKELIQSEKYLYNKFYDFDVKNYENEDLIEFSLETTETAKSLLINSKKYSIFIPKIIGNT